MKEKDGRNKRGGRKKALENTKFREQRNKAIKPCHKQDLTVWEQLQKQKLAKILLTEIHPPEPQTVAKTRHQFGLVCSDPS